MPNHKSAKKRMRQTAKRQLANKSQVSRVRTIMKSVLNSTTKAQADSLLTDAYSEIDKLAKRGIIHHKNAGNKKSLLALHVNKLTA